MRTNTAPQRAAISSAHNNHHLKLELENPDASYQDMGTYGGYDWVNSVTLDEGVDGNTMMLSLNLHREIGGTLLSLAPEREDSTLNVEAGPAYAPFLDVFRKWRASVAIMEHGVAASYELVGEGYIDTVTVNDPEPSITLTGRCLGAAIADAWISTETTYSGSMETVIQDILDDWVASPPTLYTPVSPSFTVNPTPFAQIRVFDAIQKVAKLAGFVVRFRYDASDVFRLTLYEPNRTVASEDWTLGPLEYTALPSSNIDIQGVRNRIIIQYFDDSTDVITTHTENDATSQTRYGLKVLEIDLGHDTNITTAARVNALAEDILSDLKNPAVLEEYVAPGFWIAQLGDYGKFLANGVHSDQDRFAAVTNIRHVFANGRLTTTLGVRGQPSGGYRSWISNAKPTRPDLPVSQGTVAIGEDGSVAVEIDGGDWVGSHRYATSTSAYPTLATVRSSGTNLNGRQGTFSLAAATLGLGDTIYITAIPYSLTAAGGFEGPTFKLTGTRHDASATKTTYFSASRMRIEPNGSTGTLIDSNAYISPSGTTDGDIPYATSDVLVPDGVTLTQVAWYMYQSSTSNFVRGKLARLDASAGWGYVDLSGDDDSTDVGQQVVTSSISESTTARRYKVTVAFAIQAAGGAATEANIRFSGYTITYTMPSTVNTL